MRKFLIYFLIIQCFYGELQSQCSQFVVYQSKGENYIESKMQKTKLKIQTEVLKDEKIIVGLNSLVVVISNKEKVIKLNDKGSYSYDQIKDKCLNSKSNLTKEYVRYIGEKIIEKQEPQSAMVIKGAVYRSEAKFENETKTYPENNSVVENVENLEFRIDDETMNKEREFILYENGNKVVYSTTTNENKIVLPESVELKNDAIYLWKIGDQTSGDSVLNSFVVVSKNWKEDFLNDISLMKVEFDKDLKLLKDKDTEEREKMREQYKKEINDIDKKYKNDIKMQNK